MGQQVLHRMHFHVTEQHKKSVQRYHQQLRDEAETSRSVQETDEQMSDQQVWKRLEELERQEQRRQEMQQDMYVNIPNVVTNPGLSW